MDAAGWNQRYDTTELVRDAEPIRILVAETTSLAPGTGLDLGAGNGYNAVSLAQQGWEVTAVDDSDVGLVNAHLVEVADVERVQRTVATTDGERTAIDARIRAPRPVER